MKMMTKMAAAFAVAAITAVSMAAPSQAASRYQVQTTRGAMATDQVQGQAYDNGFGWGSDARAGADAYDYVPLNNPSDINESQCTMSPGSPGYEPCENAGD